MTLQNRLQVRAKAVAAQGPETGEKIGKSSESYVNNVNCEDRKRGEYKY